ncbi:MAG TPA: DUF4258 domain-containing protein, partial [Brumimicrobium sp.]|nr:DUF4258 domain-containing protein [Brumimicrobium sp.]
AAQDFARQLQSQLASNDNDFESPHSDGDHDPPGSRNDRPFGEPDYNQEPSVQNQYFESLPEGGTQFVGGYPGQALEEGIAAGIQWLAEKIAGSDVSPETASTVQLGADLLGVLFSKGKNVNAVKNVAAKTSTSVIKGFTQHATNQAVTRGFKTTDILKIVREGTAVQAAGRYGAQTRYMLGGNTVVVNAQGKIITVFSNAPGTAKGLGKGHFIPFE